MKNRSFLKTTALTVLAARRLRADAAPGLYKNGKLSHHGRCGSLDGAGTT